MGEPLAKAWFELTIAIAISLALVPVIVALNRRAKK